MDFTLPFLVLIGFLVLYIVYLQLRMAFGPRQQAYVVMPPPPTDQGAGCGAAGLVVIAIVVGIVLTAIFGPIFLG